jgi:hypothetical protein
MECYDASSWVCRQEGCAVCGQPVPAGLFQVFPVQALPNPHETHPYSVFVRKDDPTICEYIREIGYFPSSGNLTCLPQSFATYEEARDWARANLRCAP